MNKIPELIERLRKQSPAAVAGLDDQAATRFLRAAFAAVAREIEKTPDGVVKVGGLGAFRVRTLEPKSADKGSTRRVVFRPAAPRAAKGAKGGKGAKAPANE
jgi:nucleoid DNA-binding protein